MNVNTINKFTQGNFASWTLEGNFPKITKIQGEIPTELNGVLYRNGPNPQFPDDSKHWFEGDGMLHAFTISNGNVSYSNRWIYTERFLHERKIGKVVFKSFSDPTIQKSGALEISHNTANTNIIFHAGKLLALQEGATPIEISPLDLNTKGEWDYYGQIPQMSAHPHFDARTGEMHNYAYKAGSSDIIYYIINREGKITKAETIRVPYCSFLHDFFITKDYVIFPIFPLTINLERVQEGKSLIMWEPDKGAHIGIMPRNGTEKDIIWFSTDAFHAYHFMNAYQEGDRIILDGMKYQRANMFPDALGKVTSSADFPAQLTQWVMDLKHKKLTEKRLDSMTTEFPRFDERFTGLPYRHGFAIASTNPKNLDEGFDAIIHYDLKNQRQNIREFGGGNNPSEPIFVPRQEHSEEGDGFILTVVYDAARDTSDLYILDAMNINKEALAIIQLPHRVPNGFHGNWYNK